EKEVVDRPALQAILKVRSIDSLKDKKRAADAPASESHQTNAERE
ncbi:MAG: ATP-dependent zinc metalloprotease FtsH, partial [Deltaproteobacteria bacterium]|nr:ATP-dependent zinc metalloprotease FtsH [Deltaproteobacteria bacterium]